MRERFFTAFEEVLAANKGGEVKNLLITDGDPYSLDDALIQLHRWYADRKEIKTKEEDLRYENS